jgi:hypothetical protein
MDGYVARWGTPRALALMTASAMAVAGALALAPAAKGATLYSNLEDGFVNSAHETTQTQWLAQPFVPTSSGTARVASFYAVSYLNQTTTVSVSIHSHSTANGGQPGSLLATGSQAPIDADTESAPTCTALSGTPALNAGQTYWAVMRSHSSFTGNWLFSSGGGEAPKVSTDSGGAWSAGPGAAFTLRVDDTAACAPDINTNPNAGVELGDMYAKPGGTGFQTLFASNNGVAALNLTGGSFSGPDASMFRLFKGEPGGPEGSPFTFPKSVGTGGGGVFFYVVCAPPAGTPDGPKTATLTVTSNDPDEGSLSWPVWCLVDSVPPSLEFINNPDGRNGWFVSRPAPLGVRGIDPESGNRVKRIFCTDSEGPALDWPNGSFATFGIQPDGFHDISCQGTDAANNTSEPGGYTTSMKVDATPPVTSAVEGGPPPVSDQTAFTFEFTGTDSMSGLASFECRLDNEPFEPCTSPASRSGLGNGTHTFDVRGRDVAGNYDPTPARWTWEVNAPAPEPTDDVAATTDIAALEIDVLANDVEPRGVPLHVELDATTSVMGGTVSVVGSRVRYVPPEGFGGTDRFNYRAVNANGVESAAATVTVDVAKSCRVPKLKRGTSLRAARKKLEEAGCTSGKVRRAHSKKVARGKLIRLKAKPGTVLEPGAQVMIVVSRGTR